MDNNKELAFLPVPILLHAYKSLSRAYNGEVLIDTSLPKIHVFSNNEEYAKAAIETLTMIQYAYTKGQLTKDIIPIFIEKNIPASLRENNPNNQLYYTYIKTPHDITPLQISLSKTAITALNKQVRNLCSWDRLNGIISIDTDDAHDLAIAHNTLTTLFAGFRENKNPSGRKITKQIQAAFGERYISADKRLKRRQEYQLRNRQKINPVTNHRIVDLNEINDIDLTPLAYHLRSLGKNKGYPFAALDKQNSFAKAVINKNGIPFIRLYIPVYEQKNRHEDRKIEQLLMDVIQATARKFNTDREQIIDESLVTFLLQSNKTRSSLTTPSNYKYLDISQISDIKPEDLYDVFQEWLPISKEKILYNLSIDPDNKQHIKILDSKLAEMIRAGILLQSEDGHEYKKPEPYEGESIVCSVISRDHEGNIYIRPLEWDSEKYGNLQEIRILEEDIRGQAIGIHSILEVDLSYREGWTNSVKILSIDNINNPVTDDNKTLDISHNPAPVDILLNNDRTLKPETETIRMFNASALAYTNIPEDGVLVGVVEIINGNKYFQPSKLSLGAYSLPDNIGSDLFDGDIIKVKLSPDFCRVNDIIEKAGNLAEKAGLSKLSALEHNIPLSFPDDIFAGSPSLIVPQPSKNRKDYRDVPFFTIDPETAKDFDDAIYVEPNEHGWKVMVAIADVTHYVKPKTKLFEEAFKRGNSTYLPDLTIPMLPEELSNGICSLLPNEDRACLVTTMQISSDGEITSKEFSLGLMRSEARLNYEQVQDAIEGNFGAKITKGFYEDRISPAYDVYKALFAGRQRRKALDLNTAEQVVSVENGDIHLEVDESNDSHNIIEELMIASNRAAIETLKEQKSPLIARIHGFPNERTLKQYSGELIEHSLTIS